MSSSYVSATLSDADKTAALAAVETAKGKLPFLVDLAPEERRSLPKMGDKSVAFVNAALTLVQQNPTVVPGAFDRLLRGQRQAVDSGVHGEHVEPACAARPRAAEADREIGHA